MRAKYLVIGGLVASKRDGQLHYVSAMDLIRLYKVPQGECILAEGSTVTQLGGMSLKGMRLLRPDYTGAYNINVCPIIPEEGLRKVDL